MHSKVEEKFHHLFIIDVTDFAIVLHPIYSVSSGEFCKVVEEFLRNSSDDTLIQYIIYNYSTTLYMFKGIFYKRAIDY